MILEAESWEHYVGCHCDTHDLTEFEGPNWYGESDEMIFVDGEPWPPSLHCTGTEDHFNLAWCPSEPVASACFGLTMSGWPNWSGKISLNRYQIEDPVYFEKSIRMTTEHGHPNRRSDDYPSTANWYQAEPHKPFPPLPPVEAHLPRPDG